MLSKLVSNLETEDIDYNSYPIYSKSCWMKKENWQRYPSWTNTSYMVQSKPETVKPRGIYEKSLREVNISEVAFVILLSGNHFSARHFSCCHPETFLFWNKNPPSTILWLKCSAFTSKLIFSLVISLTLQFSEFEFEELEVKNLSYKCQEIGGGCGREMVIRSEYNSVSRHLVSPPCLPIKGHLLSKKHTLCIPHLFYHLEAKNVCTMYPDNKYFLF